MSSAVENKVEDLEEGVTQVDESTQETEQSQETDQERNWKAFLAKRKEETKMLEQERERNKTLELDNARRQREIDELKEAFKAVVEKKDPNEYLDDEEEYRKKIRSEFENFYSEKEKERLRKEEETRLSRETQEVRQTMPDLMEVCNQENLAYLEYFHPEIAIPIGRMPDGIEKTKLAYQAIKKHVKMAKQEKEKIEKNLSKPKSMHASHSNETQKEESSGVLSESRRNEVWNQMQRLISGEIED